MTTGQQAEVEFRDATRDDLAEIVRLLADDPLGATRERHGERLPEEYRSAFAAIEEDPNQELLVGEAEGAIVATAQLSFLPSLSRSGSIRAQVEAVRVASERRGAGRDRAIRFYERLGFVASHQGMKLRLD